MKSNKSKATRRDFLHGGVATLAALALGDALMGCGGSDVTSDAPGGGASGQGAGGQGAGGQGMGGQAGQGMGGQAGQGGNGIGGNAGGADAGVDAATDGGGDVVQPDAGPPKRRPDTTVRHRIVGKLKAKKQSSSDRHLWGVTELGPGEPHEHRDDLNAASVATTPTGEPHSVFYGVHLTDIHIVDEESPARAIAYDGLAQPAWHAQEAHTTQVLDAVVRKIHKFDAVRPVDCVIISGDCIDNNQYNELDWFLKVLEGGTVNPDSGQDEDPRPGPDNDPHDPFKAMGLGKIPWIVSVGNHDMLIVGNFSHKPGGYSRLTGDPTRGHIGAFDMGRKNPPKCNPIESVDSPTPDRCVPTWPNRLGTGDIPADRDRRELSRKEWINMVRSAKGTPSGHGFTAKNAQSGKGDYTYDPVPGVPLRFIVLDTTAKMGARGSFDRVDSFLKPELQKAVQEKKLVVVISHHPEDETGGGDKIKQALKSCPNVILHLVGHGHKNKIYVHKGSKPENGYWEVQTSSLICWPQQGRLVELVDNRDGTMDIWLTMFDYDTDHQPTGKLVEGARFFALYEVHKGDQGNGPELEGTKEDRNVALRVAVPAEIRPLLDKLPDTPVESKLFA